MIDYCNETFLRSVLTHPHGRRMTAAMLRLGSGLAIEWKKTFYGIAKKLPPSIKKSMLPLIADIPVENNNVILLMESGLTECNSIKEGIGQAMLVISKTSNINRFWRGLTVDCLASPCIKAGAIRQLMASSDTTPKARSVLSANSNCPKELVNIREADISTVFLARAKYGDLTDKETLHEIMEHGFSFANPFPLDPDIQIKARNELAMRPDIPPSVAELLHPHTTGAAFDALRHSAGHEEFIRKELKGKTDFQDFLSYSRLDIPTDLDSDTVASLYCQMIDFPFTGYAKGEYNRTIACLALHPNVSQETLEHASKDADVCGEMLKQIQLHGSPVAERAIFAIQDSFPKLKPFDMLGDLPNTTSAALDVAFRCLSDNPAHILIRSAAALKLAAHPNFPWENHTYEEMVTSVVQADQPHLHTAMMFSDGRADYQELESVPAGMNAPSALFSPKTSGVRLAKLASQFPELATLAAMHPNGRDVKLHDQAEAVLATQFHDLFPNPLLRGKTSRTALLPTQPLEL